MFERFDPFLDERRLVPPITVKFDPSFKIIIGEHVARAGLAGDLLVRNDALDEIQLYRIEVGPKCYDPGARFQLSVKTQPQRPVAFSTLV